MIAMKIEHIPAFIPAAGYGTRLLPATLAIPKPLLPLGTVPIIVDVLWEAYYAGIRRVYIITHWRESVLKNLFEEPEDLYRWLTLRGKTEYIKKIKKMIPSLEIHFIRQEILNGLGGAIMLAEKYVNDYFYVILSDNVLFEEQKGTLLHHLYHTQQVLGSSSTFAVSRIPLDLVERFGVIAYSKEVKVNNYSAYAVKNIIEKPKKEHAPSNLVIVGRYLFDNTIFDYLKQVKPQRGEIDETEAFRRQIKDGYKIFGVDIGKSTWFDIGTVEGYLKAFIRYTIDIESAEVVKKWINEIM